jgi:hypothetical protein
MTSADIEDAFDGLLYDLHRLKHAEHGVAGLPRAISEIELVRARLLDAVERDGVPRVLITAAIRAIEVLRSAVEDRDDDRWVRDRISMVRMGIEHAIDALEELDG